MVFRNISANLLGNLWIVFLTILSTPILIKILGAESYGMVAIFAAILSILSFFDLGVSASLTKIVAQKINHREFSIDSYDEIRTLEFFYLGIGVVISLSIYLLSPYIVDGWLKLESIDTQDAVHLIHLMAITVALRWPITFYSAGLMGFEKQVFVNGLRVIYETFRILGAVLLLITFKNDINAFFIWQIISALLFTPLFFLFFWKSTSSKLFNFKFSFKSLMGLKKFTGGVAGITVISAFQLQADKIVLSGILPLSQFGYYSIASSAALCIFQLTSPIASAIFPRFSRLVSLGKSSSEELRMFYHESCQLVSYLLFPVIIVGVLFSKELLFIWTRDHELSDYASTLLKFLLLGNFLNCLMIVPYLLQLSYGWTGLSLKITLISFIFYLPLILFCAHHYGPVGVAASWLVVNFLALFISMPLMHKRIFYGDLFGWVYRDLFKIFIPMLAVLSIVNFFEYRKYSEFQLIIFITLFYLLLVFVGTIFYNKAKMKVKNLFNYMRYL